MRWRFVDRIEAFEPWTMIRGRKAVSLEEYSLLERFGRDGVLPESLVLESCVQFARWLVERSSTFAQTCLISELSIFTYTSEICMGDTLQIDIEVNSWNESRIHTSCEVLVKDRRVGAGLLTLSLMELGFFHIVEMRKLLWNELSSVSLTERES